MKPTILCLSSYFKGNRFLSQCHALGWNTVLITVESVLGEAWDRDHIDEVFALPSFADRRALLNAVSWLARSRDVQRVIALDDFDVEVAALVREHLRIPGMGETTARYFRDKLAMRMKAAEHGIAVPDFTSLVNDAKVSEFIARVPGPWLVKPRSEASSLGIKRVERAEDLWPVLDALGDDRSFHLLERMVPGDVFHVDGIVTDRTIVFAEAHRYHRPLLEVTQQGGIFATRTLPRGDTVAKALIEQLGAMVKAFGLVRGVTHTEFIRGRDDGKIYFLETSARVGGAHIAELVESTTGVNLWQEWATLELLPTGARYAPPAHRTDLGALIVSLARDEFPDDSGFSDPEVAWRLRGKKHHVGLVVVSPDDARITTLVDDYLGRIAREHQAVLPAPSKPTA